MKVRIEFLKAPWPEGAKVGHVVEIKGDAIPAWALGKCVPVDDDTPATIANPVTESAEEKAEEKKKAAK